MDQYNPTTIINEANEAFQKNKLEDAQMAYQCALLNWVDDAREMMNNKDDNLDSVNRIRDAIVLLWIEYAKLNQKANMPRAAIEAYEQAINCSIAGHVGIIWKEYANFQQHRNKYKSAQSIYLRALVGNGDHNNDNTIDGDEGYSNSPSGGFVTDVSDQEMLWNEFLEMMKKTKNDDTLTLDQLKEAVYTEHTMKEKEKRIQTEIQISDAIVDTDVDESTVLAPPSAKRSKMEAENVTSMIMNNNNIDTGVLTPNIKVSAEIVQSITSSLLTTADNISDSAALRAEWLARDGTALPTRPEPPLFSPSPPKLGDPSGKDLLGTELALKLIRLLLNKSMDGESGMTEISGNTLLGIVNGCWMMNALKEKEVATSQDTLDKKLLEDYEKMESELESRLFVAGNAISAVEQMNKSEKIHFISMCNQQRQQLQSLIAWEFRYLLAIQQDILTKAGLPYFDGHTVDSSSIHIQANICTFLHSAFYLRNRIGEAAHVAMLASQELKLESQPTTPMPLPQLDAPPVYPMPLPPPPVALPPQLPYAGQQPVFAGQLPMYGGHQPIPVPYSLPPPPVHPAHLQNQYQYR